MAMQEPDSLLTWLGFVSWGDMGELTIYRSARGNLVVFSKTWPKKPASPPQQLLRDQFTAAAAAWQEFPPDRKRRWDKAARKASLAMHGYALWVHYWMTGDRAAIETIERQTKTTLL